MRALILTMLLLVAVIFSVAVYRQWIVVESSTTEKSGDDSTRINIKIDQKKARDDIQGLVGGATLNGNIEALNVAEKQLTLKAGTTTHMLRVMDATTIERGDQKIALESLKVGEPAAVKVREENGVRVARSIAVNP